MEGEMAKTLAWMQSKLTVLFGKLCEEKKLHFSPLRLLKLLVRLFIWLDIFFFKAQRPKVAVTEARSVRACPLVYSTMNSFKHTHCSTHTCTILATHTATCSAEPLLHSNPTCGTLYILEIIIGPVSEGGEGKGKEGGWPKGSRRERERGRVKGRGSLKTLPIYIHVFKKLFHLYMCH